MPRNREKTPPTNKWIDAMNDARAFDRTDQDVLTFEIPDEALEAAASAKHHAAMSVGTPTVNILVVCCGGDNITGNGRN